MSKRANPVQIWAYRLFSPFSCGKMALRCKHPQMAMHPSFVGAHEAKIKVFLYIILIFSVLIIIAESTLHIPKSDLHEKRHSMFELAKENLLKRGYTVSCFETAADAAAYLDGAIDGKTVGFGGSMTLATMKLYEKLAPHNRVSWHARIPAEQTADEVRAAAQAAEVYISSVNALAETGEIINIDGLCNRVASVLYGHKKVYLVVGKNKLAENEEKAIRRARNIAAPLNAKRLGANTPCAVKGDRCYDCKSPDRICRALVVLWEKPRQSDIEILLVNQRLGY